MSRVQISRLASAANGLAITAVLFTVVNVKGNQFSVKAKITYSDATQVDVADGNGKVRAFKSVDDFMSAATKAGVINGNTVGVTYGFENVIALEPTPYAGDLTKKATSDLASNTKQQGVADDVIANLNAQIALYPANMTAGETASKNEKLAQRDSVAELKAWLVAEHARITAILA